MARFCDMILAAVLVAFFTEGTLSNDLVKEIDMFKEVGLLGGSSLPGVTKTTGQHSSTPAFHFTTKTQGLVANQNAYNEANKLIHNSHDFWVSAWTKIDTNGKDDNTIVSISSKAQNELYFKLMISGQSRSRGTGLDIKVSVKHKQGADYKIYSASTTDRYLYFTAWHKVAVRLQDTESLIRIYVDDMAIPLKVDVLAGIAAFPADADLRLAQVYELFQESQGSIRRRFKGDLQDVKFTKGSSSGENSYCPPVGTCKCSDALVEKNCVLDGLRYEDGRRWSKDNCTTCQCKSGQVICTYICEVCKDNGQTYMHGETWKQANDSCKTCRCQEGKSICSPPPCPKPDCTGKSGKVVIPKGQCCEVCTEDQCLGTGKVYKACGCDKTCDNFKSGGSCSQCTEGCFCPRGKVMKGGKCMANAACPCTHKGKIYKSGQQVFDIPNCKFYFCANGEMINMDIC